MKNLLIYINPRKDFDEEHKKLAKIQIDNSLSLGWKVEDILLITNFDYEYNGVKSLVVSDNLYCSVWERASKITVINYLFKKGLIEKGKIYWLHDFDAYQLNTITEEELEEKLDGKDVGFTDYGWSKKWNTGSMFFKESSEGIFKWIQELIYKYKTDEERALMVLTGDNIDDINKRIKRLNITYNIGMKKIEYNYDIATEPIKVLHFHPRKPGLLEKFKPIITNKLITIFKKHGYE